MPDNYLFLLRFSTLGKHEAIKNYVILTLKKMAYGGIYDQLGGGFARYSTDYDWKVPHFEKMLYDNAQLMSLYSEAYVATKNTLFKNVVYETYDFLLRELLSNEGSFYSALDADSEMVEGKFYVWQKSEIEELLGDDAELFCEYYNVNQHGLWEHDNYILLRRKDDETLAAEQNISTEILHEKISRCKIILLAKRNKRIRPGLDDKQLTSWNALLIKGLASAYMVFDDDRFLKQALQCAQFIIDKITSNEQRLFHNYKNGKATINGFLEDYAFVIEAWILLYQATFDEQWLHHAKALADICFEDFYDESAGMFLFKSKHDESLFSINYEIQDNVMPASNSSLARSLFMLAKYFGVYNFKLVAAQMLRNVKSDLLRYPSAYSNWGMLFLELSHPYYEVCICGRDAKAKAQRLRKHYRPNVLFAGSEGSSNLILLDGKSSGSNSLIYICKNNSCLQPISNIEEALSLIQ